MVCACNDKPEACFEKRDNQSWHIAGKLPKHASCKSKDFFTAILHARPSRYHWGVSCMPTRANMRHHCIRHSQLHARINFCEVPHWWLTQHSVMHAYAAAACQGLQKQYTAEFGAIMLTYGCANNLACSVCITSCSCTGKIGWLMPKPRAQET